MKNTLARRALEEVGVTEMEDVLSGPSTLIWGGEDIVSLSKEITKWAKELGKLEIKGRPSKARWSTPRGSMPSARARATELIGQIVGLALSPGASVAGALLGPGGTISGQVKSIADKGGGRGRCRCLIAHPRLVRSPRSDRLPASARLTPKTPD